jgi:predicted anti-sigma-YlaC factor YlaD
MSDHVLDLLGAYLDGELHGKQLRRVETHLETCQSCLDEFRALGTLSTALREAPMPDAPSPERLAADVALRLPRKQAKPMSHSLLEIGWWLVPVGLALAWIFISTTLVISRMVTAATDFGLLDNASAWLVSGASNEVNYTAFLGNSGIFENGSLGWIATLESITRGLISSLSWQVSISLLYLSWIAVWWVRHMRQGLGQPPGGGSVPPVG